jgi:hypothetical protein
LSAAVPEILDAAIADGEEGGDTDLSTQVCLTVWASLNDTAPSTTNRERVREISSLK